MVLIIDDDIMPRSELEQLVWDRTEMEEEVFEEEVRKLSKGLRSELLAWILVTFNFKKFGRTGGPSSEQDIRLVKKVLECGVSLSATNSVLRKKFGQTVLTVVMENGYTKMVIAIVTLLLEHGAGVYINQKTPNSMFGRASPLTSMLIAHRSRSFARLLMRYGLNIDSSWFPWRSVNKYSSYDIRSALGMDTRGLEKLPYLDSYMEYRANFVD